MALHFANKHDKESSSGRWFMLWLVDQLLPSLAAALQHLHELSN